MEKLATIFVSWEPASYEDVSQSKAAKLREKLNQKQKLNREEKNFITKNVNFNSYFKDSIPVGGWRFNFADVLRRFLVKSYGSWQEYLACDKTALRSILVEPIKEIHEIQ